MSHDLVAIFREALDVEPGGRAAFLDARCPDPALRAQVEALLADAAGADGGAEWPSPELPEAFSSRSVGDHSGQVLGPFRLLRPLGSGGMGTVWLAERIGGFPQQVAIKWLHAGLSEVARERFAREREALAKLEHPSIARILDGGSDGDADWFAMEFVAGLPLDQFLAQRPLVERVAMMLRICDAVQFAHQNLIVHRDLKPSNILVTEDGLPKLLDFGVARMLDRPALTESQAPMTFAYAAPEQIRGEPIGTATDVYALGVILYEVLTGERPHKPKGDGSLSLLQAITDTDARAPSASLATGASSMIRPQQLRGDLDTIVLKALSRDPRRRYASASEMKFDLQRFLRREPILARPATLGYRFGKFVRRNRAGVGAGALVLVALAGAALYSRQQAVRAQKAADDALAVQRFTLSLFEFSRPEFAPDDRIDAKALMANAEERLETANLSVEARLALLITLDNFRFDRGEYAESLVLNERRLALVREHFGETSEEFGLATLSRGYTLGNLGDAAAAERDCAAGLALLPRREVTVEHGDRVASCARLAASRGDTALAYARLDLQEALLASSTRSPEELEDLRFSLHRSRGRVAMDEGRSAEALKHLDLALATVLAAPVPWPSSIAGVNNDRALVQQRLGDFAGSAESFSRALGLWQEALGEDSVYAQQTAGSYAQMLIEAKRIDDAEKLLIEKQRHQASFADIPAEQVRFALQRAQLQRAKGNEQAALDLLDTQSMNLDQAPLIAPAVAMERARVLTAMGRSAEAVALLRSPPDEGFGRCLQGQWWFALGTAASSSGNTAALDEAIRRLEALQQRGFSCRAAEPQELEALR